MAHSPLEVIDFNDRISDLDKNMTDWPFMDQAPQRQVLSTSLEKKGIVVGTILFGNGEYTVLETTNRDEGTPDLLMIADDWRHMSGVAVALSVELQNQDDPNIPYVIEDPKTHLFKDLADRDASAVSLKLPAYKPKQILAVEAPINFAPFRNKSGKAMPLKKRIHGINYSSRHFGLSRGFVQGKMCGSIKTTFEPGVNLEYSLHQPDTKIITISSGIDTHLLSPEGRETVILFGEDNVRTRVNPRANSNHLEAFGVTYYLGTN